MDLKLIIESILFSAQKPLTPKEIREVLAGACEHSEEDSVRGLKKTKAAVIEEALEALQADHEQSGRSYQLVSIAGSWQFATQPEYAPWIKALVGHRARPPRLSQPALETLSIIAYRQPLTRAEIEKVRGVAVDGVMGTLMERGLVEQVGRAELPGRPMNYGTTPSFLEYFGLKDLGDLPAADELRKVPIEKPESLLTVDPGLETAPEDGEEEEDDDVEDVSEESEGDPEAGGDEEAVEVVGDVQGEDSSNDDEDEDLDDEGDDEVEEETDSDEPKVTHLAEAETVSATQAGTEPDTEEKQD